MQSEPFDFITPAGRHVRAALDRPAGQAVAWALFAHCFTCGKDTLASTRIARALAAEGIGTLRLDFAGLGEAGQALRPEGFSADVADLVAASRTMAERGCPPTLLVGHSLGGAAVIAAADQIPSIRAVATVAAPFDVAHVLKLLGPGAQDLMHGETLEATIAGRQVRVDHAFVQDVKAQDQAQRLAGMNRALLILHSPVDQVVSIDEASALFRAARHPKSFVSLDRADHLLSDPADAAYAARVIAGWAGRYVMTEAQPAAPDHDGTVRVEETGQGRFQARVTAGPTTFLADEPTEVGGLGSGPNPYQLVAAGLGACTAMTLRLYAERKGWPLTRTRVEVSHARDAGQTPPDRFDRVLTVEGELDAEQRARLLEIADKCPVHRTLEGGARVATTVTEAQVTVAQASSACMSEDAHFADMTAMAEES